MTDYNIDFKDHKVQFPNRFKQVQVSPGVVDLIPTWIENPSEVIEEGTPVNADLFDKLRANVTRRSETFAATAGQTVFNLTSAYIIDQGRIDVYISGVKQRSGVDFTETSPTSFTLSEGLDAGTIVEAVYFSASQALSEDLIEQVQAAEAATIAANEATADAIDATEAALTANLIWKEPVNNLTALNALSNPQTRDTRQTKDTGNVYRYDGSAWVLIQTMDPNAITALDTRLSAQLADIADLFLVNFKLPAEVTFDEAVTRAIASADSSRPLQLTFPKGAVKLNAVVTRRKNLTISGYGTTLVPTNATEFMWTHYGDYFTSEGFEVEGETIDTHRGFKVSNDATTTLSSYAKFKDMNFVDVYQALDFYSLGGIGGAAYRHHIENVRIRNWTNPKTRVGSFGIRFDGNVAGDAAGNDTTLLNVFVKGYEKNIIIKRSVGTKLTQCSIDGGKYALELDGGSFLSLVQCYVEYNDTNFLLSNAPYRAMALACTFANFTTDLEGSFYNNELLLNYSGSSPVFVRTTRLFNGTTYSIARGLGGNGAGLYVDNQGKSYDFIRAGSKYSLIPSDDIDLYHHIGATKKHHFGNATATRFSTIDENGVIAYDTLVPAYGIYTIPSGTTSPDVGRYAVMQTSNAAGTSIVRLDYGMVGQKMTLIINDNNTTLVHGASLKLKGRTNKTCQQYDTFEFICLEAPTDTTNVWIEI